MSICSDIISFALKSGAEQCESIFCAKKITTIRITDSEIVEIKESYEKSIGTRLVMNKKICSAQSAIMDPRSLVEEALHVAKNLAQKEFWTSFPENIRDIHIEKTNDQKIWNLDAAKISQIAQTMIDAASHQKISRISGSLNVVCDDFQIQNTSGLFKSEKSTYIAGGINAEADIKIPVSGIGQANSRTLNSFEPARIGSDAAKMCSDSTNPSNAENLTTSIVFDPLAVGELLFFVLGPNFNLKTFSEKKSCFSNKGDKIAIEDLNIDDNPHISDNLGAKSFDDEGVPTRINQLIKNGIFENTYSDTYNAVKEKSTSSGNASRSGVPLGRSASPITFSSPHNLTISSGNQDREEIIKDTKNGILIGRLWYTYAVNPIRGDFSCTARNGVFQIRNGQLTPIKSVRIIHNLPNLLQNISAIGNNSTTVLPWAGSPVTCPTIRCEGISVVPI